LDKISINTDQNVAVEFELASVFQRFTAAIIDFVILMIYFSLMTFFLIQIIIYDWFNGIDDMSFWGFFFIFVIYLPFFLYTPLMEFLTKGRTVGKMVLGIRVMKTNGDNGSGSTYFTRWLFRPFEAYIYLLGPYAVLVIFVSGFLDLILASTSTKNQRLGDFLASSVVVKNKADDRFSLNDILAIKSNENYTVSYPNVIQFSEEDMLLVKQIIGRVETFKNKSSKELGLALADEIAEQLGLDKTPQKKLTFLKTILRDYIVLTR
jgi:uncharacterized RDD family membrane protein YckC